MDTAEQIGERIIDAIIQGKLVRAECMEDKSHLVIFVWSANAPEQIGQQVRDLSVKPNA